VIKKLQRVTFGRTTIPESWIFRGGQQEKAVPIILSVFLIETESRKILVDAGCNTMPGFELKEFVGPAAALQAIGVEPDTITDVIITHAHHDHIEGVFLYENATVYIQEAELAKGRKYIPEHMPVVTFTDRCDLEDGIRILKIAGHSVGSCIVECDYNGKCHVLCGDECYSFYNLDNRVPAARSRAEEISKNFIEHYANPQYECLLCHMERE